MSARLLVIATDFMWLIRYLRVLRFRLLVGHKMDWDTVQLRISDVVHFMRAHMKCGRNHLPIALIVFHFVYRRLTVTLVELTDSLLANASVVQMLRAMTAVTTLLELY